MTYKVSSSFLASIEEMGLTREYDAEKNAVQPIELTLPITLYKELDSKGKLDLSDRIASYHARLGKTGALYVNGVRLAHAYAWRLMSVDVTELHNDSGYLTSAKIECTLRSLPWPKDHSYSKWRAAMKKAATKKTKKKTTKKSKKKTNAQVATEVIKGKWGKTAAVRKKKLTAAGYNYTAVMKIVNAKKKKK